MLRKPSWIVAALIGLVTAGCGPSLAAPPRLIAVAPMAGARLPVELHTFDLSFNRRLSTEATWVSVWREDDGGSLATETTIDPGDARRMRVRLLEARPGSYRLHWHAVAVRAPVATDGEQDFTLQGESVAPPRLELSRTTAETGEVLEIVGHGFGKKRRVQITIGDDQQDLTTIETDARGAFDTETRVPANVPFGMQPLSAEDGRGARATAALHVRWGGWPPVAAVITGRPGPRPGELTFSLTVRNRSDYLLERVRAVVSDSPGTTFVAADPGSQRQAGATVWEIPTMDRGVVGPFRATYRAEAMAVGHAWVEFRHRRTLGCTSDECLPAFISDAASESHAVWPADSSATRGVSSDREPGTRQRQL